MSEPPEIELDRHEWRLKGAKRIKAFKKQPRAPIGRERGPLAKFLVTLCGIWAGCVIIWAHQVHGQNPWVIGPIALGPGLFVLFIMHMNDG